MPTGIATRGGRAGPVFDSLTITITIWLAVASNVPDEHRKPLLRPPVDSSANGPARNSPRPVHGR